MRIRLTKHAELTTSERQLPLDWVTLTVQAPDWTEPDPETPALPAPSRSSQRREIACCGLSIARIMGIYWSSPPSSTVEPNDEIDL